MSNLIVYEANGIVVPTDLKERYAEVFAATSYRKYGARHYKPQKSDSYALIHDVFRTRDGSRIIALDSNWYERHSLLFEILQYHRNYKLGEFEIGSINATKLYSALSELTKELHPLRVYWQGRELKYNHDYLLCGDYFRLNLRFRDEMLAYEIVLPPELQNQSVINLEFVFGDGRLNQKVAVPQNPFINLPATSFILHTLQKDNPVEWIEDWCTYYYREHGVKRIVIYDNDSTNRKKLEQCLAAVKLPIDLILIDWPYSYNSYFNSTQLVALNHSALIFSDSGKYYMNFDIDEYLVNLSNLWLEQYLQTQDDGKKAYFSVQQRVIPHFTTNKRSKTLLRVTDFQYAENNIGERAPKTINVYDRFDLVNPHYTRTKPTELPFILDYLLRKLGYLLKLFPKAQHNRRIYNFLKEVTKVLNQASSPTEFVEMIRHRKYKPLNMNASELYFNHYRGLSTSWKYDNKIFDEPPPNSVLDTVMIKKLHKAEIGLNDENTQQDKEQANV